MSYLDVAQRMSEGWQPGGIETPEQEAARTAYLRDRHHPMLGQHPPFNRIPDWPDIEFIAGHQRDRVLPTHHRAYTRHPNGDVLAESAPTREQARYLLRLRIEGA